MLKLFVSVCLFLVTSSFGEKITYPDVRRDTSVVDEYFGGIKVADPYRWLEDPNSGETKKFVADQNAITEEYLNKSASVRVEIVKSLTDAYNYSTFTLPYRRGSRYVYLSNSGVQNQHVIYIQDSLEGKPRVFFDPNTLSTDGTISLSKAGFSKDGELWAYGLSTNGSDWVDIRIRNVSSGQDFPEVLTDSKFFGYKWTHDGAGFFYARFPRNGNGTEKRASQVYYHLVGTNQTEDVLILEVQDQIPSYEVSWDGKYLFVLPVQGVGKVSFHFARLDDVDLTNTSGVQGKLKLIPVVESFDSDYQYVTSDDSGSVVYLLTNKGAPNYKLVAVDLNRPQEIHWSTVIPEDPSKVLESIKAINEDKLVLKYLDDVKSRLEVRYLRNGSFIQEIPIEIGNIEELSGDRDDSEFLFSVVSFLSPGKAYKVNLKKEPYEPKLFREVKSKGFDPSKFVTKQVFFTSKDGTRVPMFIVHKKDFKPEGNAPTYLYGYGGFGINMLPYYSPHQAVFIQNFNGIYAVPNIRGGGEYGATWHSGGQVLNKQNSFDDFQAAAQYLYDNKYTTQSKLFINGGSNGGLLVGACVNQRPDLFGAAIAQVGVLDLLRYQKFTIGYVWCQEYGCSDTQNISVIENLKNLSPVHNVKVPEDSNVQYPSVLLLTGDYDDRVVPFHSYKFAAELQHLVGRSERQTNPLLLKVNTKAGHGAGKPTTAQIEEYADMFTFIVQTLSLKFIS